MPSQSDLKTQLLRALNHSQGQQTPWRTTVSTRTTRDNHPTSGSAAILQQATSGARPIATSSLNVRRSDGSQGKRFSWGIMGFGWGQGEWEEPS